jgi:thiol-disulfide isomerase/thioredoxin
VQGPTFDTAATHDRVVVVDFFAAYCRPCQKSLPVLQRLVRENRGVTVVGVSLDDDPAAARLQIVRHGLTFPVIHDRARSLAGRFRVVDIPASFVVDRGGRIAWVAGPQHAAEAVAQAVASMGKDGPEEQQ